jgi:hypothetical protein
MEYMTLEIIGWIGTVLLVFSYLAQGRMSLHLIAFVSTVMKTYYCYQREVWPLFANWVVLLFVHIYKMRQLWQEKRRLSREKG